MSAIVGTLQPAFPRPSIRELKELKGDLNFSRVAMNVGQGIEVVGQVMAMAIVIANPLVPLVASAIPLIGMAVAIVGRSMRLNHQAEIRQSQKLLTPDTEKPLTREQARRPEDLSKGDIDRLVEGAIAEARRSSFPERLAKRRAEKLAEEARLQPPIDAAPERRAARP